MQITWVAYNIIEQVGERYVSNVASARYRLILPAQALTGMGHRIRLLQVGPDSRLDEVARKMDGELVVFLKLATPDTGVFDRMAKLTLGMLRAAREQGKRVVADISDDHFGHPHLGGYFRELVNEVDFVVASTPGMAGIIRPHTQRPVHTVSDPYEGARHGVKFEPPPRKARGLLGQTLRAVTSGGRSRPLRLLWFGHVSNFATVFDLISQLHRLVDRWRVEVHLVTAPETNAAVFCEEFNRDYAPACSLRFSPWSLETTWRALEECDMVVIPSRLNDPAKAVKSPNRLIESLWAGRFVCANPVPSYQEFDRFAWLGEDIVSGIEWALEHPREVRRRIDAAQQYIAQHYSPEVIAKQWETAFVAARNAAAVPPRSVAVRPQENAPVRLNLGCGDKILPGYINVDIAASRGNAKPDVLCDLHRLTPYGDASADEILSVHVVEHFWRWEVVDVLKEWARVLKPGGKMIIECPNLLSACEELMRNPQAASGPGVAGQRSMWVLYGDPSWKDPLMVHRWGYTPQSLVHVMSEAGLVNVRQEPAQFKLREPRDMRLVGEKPAHAEHAAGARPTTAAQAPSKRASGPMPAYSRANPSPRYLELQNLYRTMHQEGEKFLGVPPEETFPGKSLTPQVHRIKALIRKTGALLILDYGSGKGKQYDPWLIKDGAGGEWPSVMDYWDVDEVVCYDPCYPPFSKYPGGKFDGVISTDVLEHCPEEDIPWIIDEIFSFATRFVFANVACYPARKRLPTGENAHCTIQPVEWWKHLIEGIAASYPGVTWEVRIQSRVDGPQGSRLVEQRIGNT